jgi:hypothetical protein
MFSRICGVAKIKTKWRRSMALKHSISNSFEALDLDDVAKHFENKSLDDDDFASITPYFVCKVDSVEEFNSYIRDAENKLIIPL